MEDTMKARLARISQPGRIDWIGLRSGRGQEVLTPGRAYARVGGGLRLDEQGDAGDRYQGRSGARAVTLIQAEHLPVIAACSGHTKIEPATLRRNLLVAGINLFALKGRRFRVGGALLEFTGLCHPCSNMEEALGPGGYSAMRMHGGITARIIESGWIALGDALNPEGPVTILSDETAAEAAAD